MHTIRTATAGILLGVLAVLCAIGPADAATLSSPAAAVQPHTQLNNVNGESWSAPAYPVTCNEASGQVSCTPTNPSDVKPQACFAKVLMRGATVTVCTTYDGHHAAIVSAGGVPLLVDYGCSFGDAVCATFENAGRGMALTATSAMMLVASSMRFDTSSVLWTAAVNEWSFWQWAVLVVLFAAMVWSIAAAVVSGDRDELVGVIIRSFLAVPAVPLTLWMLGHLLNSVDDLTWYILNRDGPAVLFRTLQKVMWAGGHANYFFAFLIHGMLLLSMLLLVLVFTFRNIALAALITVGPVAWMLFPVKSIGPQWVVRYVSATVALLLSGPLTIGFVTLIINGLAQVKTIWDPQSWPLMIGLALAAFAPFAVFGLFNFVGASASDALGSRLGSGAGRAASGAARSAARLPSRLGSLPSGVTRAAVPARAAAQAGSTSARRGVARPAGTSTTGSRPAASASSAAPKKPTSPRPASPPTSAPAPRPEGKQS
ncbi:hypothetical protein [Microbacterium suwonense]|uniref:TrbL/VirB6 plasmid conjugal transfer protein n=2 Tax=Microbacterium suwonense TaxID=683047 RepID=A0ABM8FUR7_9MICO|nr:hypothetical protein [Microbacterium suwonense]BDZ39331.1 hypothetical protein GCM10025863_19450 [Microbacterium suwonense]